VQWYIPGEEERPIFRSYSLSSAPHDTYIEFCIKLLPGGKASTMIEQAAVGDTLNFRGPNGRFTNTQTEHNLSFIATGTGIAPIIGIIRDELEYKKNTHNIHVLFGVRTTADIFWQQKFQELTTQYPNFTYHICLSQDEHEQCKKGRVTTHIESKPHTNYFLCGNRDMVMEVRNTLIEKNIPTTNIHFEIF